MTEYISDDWPTVDRMTLTTLALRAIIDKRFFVPERHFSTRAEVEGFLADSGLSSLPGKETSSKELIKAANAAQSAAWIGENTLVGLFADPKSDVSAYGNQPPTADDHHVQVGAVVGNISRAKQR